MLTIVNKSKRPVYVARKRFKNFKFNGYGRVYRVDPGEIDRWGDNENLVYSPISIDDHNDSIHYFDRYGERGSGTWTYTFTDGGVSHDEGTVL